MLDIKKISININYVRQRARTGGGLSVCLSVCLSVSQNMEVVSLIFCNCSGGEYANLDRQNNNLIMYITVDTYGQ